MKHVTRKVCMLCCNVTLSECLIQKASHKASLYFAWEDQRDKVYCIFHKVAPLENKVQLCGKYSIVMQIVVIVLGVKFLSVTTVTTDFKLNQLLIL